MTKAASITKAIAATSFMRALILNDSRLVP